MWSTIDTVLLDTVQYTTVARCQWQQCKWSSISGQLQLVIVVLKISLWIYPFFIFLNSNLARNYTPSARWAEKSCETHALCYSHPIRSQRASKVHSDQHFWQLVRYPFTFKQICALRVVVLFQTPPPSCVRLSIVLDISTYVRKSAWEPRKEHLVNRWHAHHHHRR